MTIPDFSLSDFIFLIIKLAIAAYFLRWFLAFILHHFSTSQLSDRSEEEPAPAAQKKKPKRRPAIKHTGPKLRVEKVFHVGAPDGRFEIVMTEDEADAKKVGAASLGIEEDEVVVAEVYDKAVRR